MCECNCSLLLLSHSIWWYMLYQWQSHIKWSQKTYQEQSSMHDKLQWGSKQKIPQNTVLIWTHPLWKRLTLIPPNMMLGIFSTKTPKSNSVWETVYYHPNLSSLTPPTCNKKLVSLNNIEDLHRGLEAALCSFWSQCNITTLFPNLPWNNITQHLSIKFAVAFVVGVQSSTISSVVNKVVMATKLLMHANTVTVE